MSFLRYKCCFYNKTTYIWERNIHRRWRYALSSSLFIYCLVPQSLNLFSVRPISRQATTHTFRCVLPGTGSSFGRICLNLVYPRAEHRNNTDMNLFTSTLGNKVIWVFPSKCSSVFSTKYLKTFICWSGNGGKTWRQVALGCFSIYDNVRFVLVQIVLESVVFSLDWPRKTWY